MAVMAVMKDCKKWSDTVTTSTYQVDHTSFRIERRFSLLQGYEVYMIIDIL